MTELQTLLAVVTALITIATAVVGVIARSLWPMSRKMHQALDDFNGQPARPDAGIPERPGLMKRVARTEEILTELDHTLLQRNERFDRIDRRLDEIATRVARNGERLDRIELTTPPSLPLPPAI